LETVLRIAPLSAAGLFVFLGALFGGLGKGSVQCMSPKPTSSERMKMMSDQAVSCVGRLRFFPGPPPANSNLETSVAAAEEDPT
jgi:hypothetical protein